MKESRWIFSIAETSRLIGLSEKTVSEAIKRGQLPAIRIGKRMYVLRKALEEMLNEWSED